jgi:hypothetical protein
MLAVVGMGTALVSSVWHRRRVAASPPAHAVPSASSLKTGDEMLVIFIGGSFCGGSAQPGLREAVATVNREMAATARAAGRRFVSVGVAMDWSVEDGVRFLHEFGKFDELVVGRNWLNSAVVRYVWRDVPGSATLPQIVVVMRHVTVAPTTIAVGDERLLVRKLGADEIIDWARHRGAM